ncbi:protein tyrosine phosphatase [Desulforamulus reducens MI-1]|uniref:Protein tyrosine phosphatase n=1 Tax=Desulforamulus reducens (strain ATCC BAA-1160 / DSM 100696 / MI-1) TaxID=349161 RepID=A4J9B3_DESRM|nr:low molecular weight protein arginine phosphatase [Desulforamulus reducens]ABO51666.1 protein tyrosine phosphatase [Desulforamulus reducens MI-1]
MGKKILFVCTGNTCRSSMAEALAKALAEEKNLGGYTFLSAGTMAWTGEKASQQAVEVLGEQGIELSQHRAMLLTPELVTEADLILTMTENHRQQIIRQAPESQGKVFTLGDYVGENGDVSDPFGSPVETYRRCAGELKNLISKALDKLSKDSL